MPSGLGCPLLPCLSACGLPPTTELPPLRMGADGDVLSQRTRAVRIDSYRKGCPLALVSSLVIRAMGGGPTRRRESCICAPWAPLCLQSCRPRLAHGQSSPLGLIGGTGGAVYFDDHQNWNSGLIHTSHEAANGIAHTTRTCGIVLLLDSDRAACHVSQIGVGTAQTSLRLHDTRWSFSIAVTSLPDASDHPSSPV
jgi:hypothetical protein